MNPKEDLGIIKLDRGLIVITPTHRRYLFRYKFISAGDDPWASCKLIRTLEPLERKVIKGSSKLAPIETLEWGD